MPRKKKKWIDKKNATTYMVVHRSQKDPLAADNDSSQHVLVPYDGISPTGDKYIINNNKKDTTLDGQFEDAEDQDVDDEVDNVEIDDKELIPRVLGLPSGYDYSKHMRPIGAPGGVFISPDGKFHDSEELTQLQHKLPPQAMASNYEEEVGLLEREIHDPDLDPELLEAMENYDESRFEELPDDFLELANQDIDDKNVVLGNYGSMDDIDDDIKPKKVNKPDHEDIYDDEDDDRSSEMVEASSASVTNRPRTIEDDMFDVALKKFDRDLEELYGPGDDNDDDGDDDDMGMGMPGARGAGEGHILDIKPPPVKGSLFDPVTRSYHASAFEHVFDEFLGTNPKVPYQAPHEDPNETERNELPVLMDDTIKKLIIKDTNTTTNGEGTDDDDDEELEEIFFKEKRSEWDCESIVSTYSNLYNHPAIIAEPENRIKLNKKGFPDIKLRDDDGDDEVTDADGNGEESKPNLGVARQKHEPSEEKKLRKKAIKEERKMRRGKKKDLKQAYKEESIKQRTEVAGKIVNRTILHF